MQVAPKRVLVVGAGVTGLALTQRLQALAKSCNHAVHVTLVDAAERVGGWVHTNKDTDFLFEQGPRSLITRRGEQTIELIEELGLQGEVAFARKAAFKRYLWSSQHGGELNMLPTGLGTLWSPTMKGVLSGVLHDIATSPSDVEDESVHEFITRRFNTQVADGLIDPMVAGIYAGDPKQLSVRSCFNILHQLEREHGSVSRGMMARKKQAVDGRSDFFKSVQKASIYSFRDGMSTLPHALRDAVLPECELRLGTTVSAIDFPSSSGRKANAGAASVTLQSADGTAQECSFDHVVTTLSADALARMVEGLSAPKSESSSAKLAKHTLVSELRSIPHASVYTVNIGYKQPGILPVEGFGVLVPTKEGMRDLLGITFDSDAFPMPEGQDDTRITCMLGGARYPEWVERHAGGPLREAPANPNYPSMDEVALQRVEQVLGVTQDPDAVVGSLAYHCIPQYPVGHYASVRRMHQAAAEWAGDQQHIAADDDDAAAAAAATATATRRLHLLGTGVHGVSVNDCISSARRTAELIMS